MLLRKTVRNAVRLFNSSPMSVKASSVVDVAVETNGIAIVTMQRLPVNSINLDFVQELSKALDDLTRDGVKAMILTSVSLILKE